MEMLRDHHGRNRKGNQLIEVTHLLPKDTQPLGKDGQIRSEQFSVLRPVFICHLGLILNLRDVEIG